MKQIDIRPARPEDLPKLLEFEQGIIAFERPFDPTLKPGPISYYDISAMISADDSAVRVAVCDGEIVGSGYAKIIESKPYCVTDQHAYLGFMFVPPAFRGQGIISLIIDSLREWSRKQGISELRLEVYSDNPGAVRAYEKAGFVRNLIEMRQTIED